MAGEALGRRLDLGHGDVVAEAVDRAVQVARHPGQPVGARDRAGRQPGGHTDDHHGGGQGRARQRHGRARASAVQGLPELGGPAMPGVADPGHQHEADGAGRDAEAVAPDPGPRRGDDPIGAFGDEPPGGPQHRRHGNGDQQRACRQDREPQHGSRPQPREAPASRAVQHRPQSRAVVGGRPAGGAGERGQRDGYRPGDRGHQRAAGDGQCQQVEQGAVGPAHRRAGVVGRERWRLGCGPLVGRGRRRGLGRGRVRPAPVVEGAAPLGPGVVVAFIVRRREPPAAEHGIGAQGLGHSTRCHRWRRCGALTRPRAR